MKLFLALILTFLVLADFTSASVLELGESSICESISSCDDVDLHKESNKEHEDENHEHHCHCHTGHSHSAVTYRVGKSFKAIQRKSLVKYPHFKQGKLQNYHSEIIRPPIA